MAIDMAVGSLKKASGEFGKVNSSMSQLVGQSDESARVIEQSFAMINLAVSVMEIGLGIQKMYDLIAKDREAVKAAALTAANSINPAGWAKIAVATAASVAVGAGLAMYMNAERTNPSIEQKIAADLSTASGRTAVSQIVGGIA